MSGLIGSPAGSGWTIVEESNKGIHPMARKNRRFSIASAPRATRRAWVRRAWAAHRHNTGEALSLREAWQAWDVADCGPQTWVRLIERNGIRCIA